MSKENTHKQGRRKGRGREGGEEVRMGMEKIVRTRPMGQRCVLSVLHYAVCDADSFGDGGAVADSGVGDAGGGNVSSVK